MPFFVVAFFFFRISLLSDMIVVGVASRKLDYGTGTFEVGEL